VPIGGGRIVIEQRYLVEWVVNRSPTGSRSFGKSGRRADRKGRGCEAVVEPPPHSLYEKVSEIELNEYLVVPTHTSTRYIRDGELGCKVKKIP